MDTQVSKFIVHMKQNIKNIQFSRDKITSTQHLDIKHSQQLHAAVFI